MTILITGGAGFVGSHLARALLRRGDRVVALDNFNDYYDPAIKRANARDLAQQPGFTLIEGDIRDTAALETLFHEHGVRRVAHLAAMAGVRESMRQPALYLDVNLTGTFNLLEAARRHGVENFVFASTSSVYGETQTLPFVETDAADRPLAAYPASKRAAEILTHTYHHLHQLNVTVLRFFNVYGPAGRPDMMPLRVMNALLDGTEIPLFNGGNLHRDWTYIDDTVQGVIAALDTPLGYEIMNLGVGAPISLREFIDVLEDLSGRTLRTRDVPAPPSDPPITFCDNAKIRRLLGFNPTTRVHDGLAQTWDWFRHWRQQTGTWPGSMGASS
ncbi:MAG: SDR family NAD(P)-dependent oxidoreductase [Anaerolineae bacterium]|nr:SDR family NAD(P)-dependent oxidoreductase [Anaerolineae bacterium]